VNTALPTPTSITDFTWASTVKKPMQVGD